MKKTRYTEEQIAFALKQAATGTRVEEVCRKMGISEATFYNWKKKFGGMGVTKLRRLRQLEEENQRLKRLVADLSLDKVMLRKLSKKVLRPAQKRQAVHFLREAYRISVRRGCGLLMQSRTVTVARVFIFSCGGKAGLLTTRKHTGFTVWKASTCAKSAPAGMSVQHIVSNVRS